MIHEHKHTHEHIVKLDIDGIFSQIEGLERFLGKTPQESEDIMNVAPGHHFVHDVSKPQ